MAKRKLNNTTKRRIIKLFPFSQLVEIHGFVVVLQHHPQNRMRRIKCLYKHFPLFVFPSRAACNLRHELETSFKSPEIGIGEQTVRIQYSNQADMIEIKTFGYHLCPNKNINLS